MIARDRNTSGDDSVLEERLYALQDANFSVTAVADASGNVVERYLFDPYGQRLVLDANFSADADGQSDVQFQHGHQGGKYDSVLTNQMLFRHRVYDVEAMRWLQQDPLGYVDGQNVYVALAVDPISMLDPLGTDTKTEIAMKAASAALTAVITSTTGRPEEEVRPIVNRLLEKRSYEELQAVVQASAGDIAQHAWAYGEEMADRRINDFYREEVEEAARHMLWQAAITFTYGEEIATITADAQRLQTRQTQPAISITIESDARSGKSIGRGQWAQTNKSRTATGEMY